MFRIYFILSYQAYTGIFDFIRLQVSETFEKAQMSFKVYECKEYSSMCLEGLRDFNDSLKSPYILNIFHVYVNFLLNNEECNRRFMITKELSERLTQKIMDL